MAKLNKDFGISSKHLQIEKANTNVLIAACVAIAVLAFSLVAAQALFKQIKYQNKVIGLRSEAVDQLNENIKATEQLKSQYVAFDTAPESIIGNSEPNTKIVLNSLPSKYDFPALATSLENATKIGEVSISAITGTDDQVNAEQSSISPQPKEIPFTLSAKGSYDKVQKLVTTLEKSIRPIKINKISLKGSDGSMEVTIEAVAYYQPVKKLDLDKKVVTPDDSKKQSSGSSSSSSSTSGSSSNGSASSSTSGGNQ